MQLVQDLRVFDIKASVFCSILPKILLEGVRSFVSFSLTGIDLIIILCQLLSLTHLCGAQTFYVHKVAQVFVLCNIKDLMLVIFLRVALILKSFNNCKKLLIVSSISSLCKDDFLRKKSDQVLLAEMV